MCGAIRVCVVLSGYVWCYPGMCGAIRVRATSIIIIGPPGNRGKSSQGWAGDTVCCASTRKVRIIYIYIRMVLLNLPFYHSKDVIRDVQCFR